MLYFIRQIIRKALKTTFQIIVEYIFSELKLNKCCCWNKGKRKHLNAKPKQMSAVFG